MLMTTGLFQPNTDDNRFVRAQRWWKQVCTSPTLMTTGLYQLNNDENRFVPAQRWWQQVCSSPTLMTAGLFQPNANDHSVMAHGRRSVHALLRSTVVPNEYISNIGVFYVNWFTDLWHQMLADFLYTSGRLNIKHRENTILNRSLPTLPDSNRREE